MSTPIFHHLYTQSKTIEINSELLKSTPKKKLKVITLFSGYGSQELALRYSEVEHQTIAHSDIYRPANDVFNALHTTELGNLGDITKIDEKKFPECDLLTFSFPCQSLSIAGKQEGIALGTRSGLLFEVERIIKHNKPKFLMMENVKNLVSKTHMVSFQRHLDLLHSLGYGTYWRVLNAADFGCPQNRERVLMMAVLGESKKTVKSKMLNIDKHQKGGVAMRSSIEDNVNPKLFIPCELETNTPKSKASKCLLVAKIKGIKYEQAARVYSIDGTSPCLTKSAVPKIMTDEGKVRYISAREGYRFMGIKEEDIDRMLETPNISENTHVSMAGNSICVPVMEAIFTEFFKPAQVRNVFWGHLKRVA